MPFLAIAVSSLMVRGSLLLFAIAACVSAARPLSSSPSDGESTRQPWENLLSQTVDVERQLEELQSLVSTKRAALGSKAARARRTGARALTPREEDSHAIAELKSPKDSHAAAELKSPNRRVHGGAPAPRRPRTATRSRARARRVATDEAYPDWYVNAGYENNDDGFAVG